MKSRLKSRETRGYGLAHRTRRQILRPMVEAGLVDCARCGQRILVGEEWDLGHDGTTTSTAASTSGLSIEGVIGARRFGVADLDDNGVWVIGDMSRLNRD